MKKNIVFWFKENLLPVVTPVIHMVKFVFEKLHNGGFWFGVISGICATVATVAQMRSSR